MPVRNTDKLLRAMEKIQKSCADYYDMSSDEERRHVVQDIWRQANFAVIAERRRRYVNRQRRKGKR